MGFPQVPRPLWIPDSPSRQPKSWWSLPRRPRIALACLIGLAVIALPTLRVLRRGQPSPPQPLSSEALTTPPKGISAIGRIEPKGEVINVSAPALVDGAKILRLHVSLGDKVQKGQIIAILDNHERLLRALDLSRQQLRVSQARLLQVEAGAKAGDIQAQTSRIEQLRRELDGQNTSQLLSIKRLAYESQNARTECKRYIALFQVGAVSASQKDTICLLADTTQQQELEAQAQLQRTRQTLTQQIYEASSKRTAIAEVRPIDVSVARAEAEEAYAHVKQAEAELALSIVRSPHPGQVLLVIAKEGERVGNEGIIKLGNTSLMTVVAEVYETDVSRVRRGQKAMVNSSAVADTLEGVVDQVGLSIGKKDVLGTDPAAASDARVLEVTIDLAPDSSKLVRGLTNLQVDVVILSEPQSQ